VYVKKDTSCYLFYSESPAERTFKLLKDCLEEQKKVFISGSSEKIVDINTALNGFLFSKTLAKCIEENYPGLDAISIQQANEEAFLQLIDPSIARKFNSRKDEELLIELSCGHKLPRKTLKSICKERKRKIKGYFIIPCVLCEKDKYLSFLTINDIAKIFAYNKTDFDLLFKNTDEEVKQCMVCGDIKNIEFIHSNHTICKSCLQFYLRQKNSMKADAKAKCPACDFRFVITAEIKPDVKEMEYSLKYPFSFPNAKSVEEGRIYTCNKCGNIDESLYKNTKCSHEICNQCIKEAIRYCLNNKLPFMDCQCPVIDCSNRLPLKALIQSDQSEDKNDKKELKQLINDTIENLTMNTIVPCSDCDNHLKVISKISEYPDSCKSCINCGTRHTKGKCRLESEYKGKVEQMYKLFFDSYGSEVKFTLKPCPYCLRLFPSIPPLSEIKCPGCSKLYCGDESCKMGPISAHGKSYHRPRCKYYKYGKEIIHESPKCEECKKLKRICNPPKDLDKNNYIPEDEQR